MESERQNLWSRALAAPADDDGDDDDDDDDMVRLLLEGERLREENPHAAWTFMAIALKSAL